MAERLGVENVEDVVMKDFKSTEHPRFVVITDHTESQVVLCIRGTYSIGDAIIDIVCDEVPFLDGYAHHGMVDGANRILNKVKPLLRELLLDKFPGYKLRITGHSLGAGTAELVTMTLLSSKDSKDDEWLNEIDIKCIALAPPPVYRPGDMAKKLEEDIQKNIIIFVNGNDCVPRLSLANCAWLLAALRGIDNLKLTTYDQLSIIVQKSTTKELPILRPTNVVNDLLKQCQTAIANIDVQYQEKFKYLGHPSHFVYYLSPTYDKDIKILSVSLVRKKAKYFSHLLLMFSKMIADHFQWNYEESLNKVASINEEQNGVSDVEPTTNCKVITSNNGSSLVLM